jgi:hypothetical protein
MTYRPARTPEVQEIRRVWLANEPVAPLSWPVEVCFVAADTAYRAYTARYQGWRRAARGIPLALALTIITLRARPPLERRRARKLGLTIETAPERNVDWLGSVAPLAVWRGYLIVRGLKPREPPWPHALAQQMVGEINRRREWRSALVRAASRPQRPPVP